jgi:hypothetical protein
MLRLIRGMATIRVQIQRRLGEIGRHYDAADLQLVTRRMRLSHNW